jgi:sugar lactone lactonase YvrE
LALVASALVVLGVAAISPGATAAQNGNGPKHRMSVTLLAHGLQGTVGATIGPDGALYVAEAGTGPGDAGRITRIDPWNGKATTFASGLPARVIPLGGAIDVAFVGNTMYVLVTAVGPDVGGTSVDGIYRFDDPGFTVFADIGAWALANPPATAFDLSMGVQFALQPVADGFLVTDGHHNRVLHVSPAGEVTQLIQFDNIVPTGLAVAHHKVFMAEAGPVPYAPETGKVVSFRRSAPVKVRDVASGYSLITDVECGGDGGLYALSQGESPGDVAPGSPALPDSGRLLAVNRHGGFSVLLDKLNLPTSLDFVGNTAFVTTLAGDVWKIKHVSTRGSAGCDNHGD